MKADLAGFLSLVKDDMPGLAEFHVGALDRVGWTAFIPLRPEKLEKRFLPAQRFASRSQNP
jgi:hypothetical protein